MWSFSAGSKIGQPFDTFVANPGKLVSLKDAVRLLAVGSGTIPGAARKLKALPKLLKTNAIPVAVVRSFGGNQADETADGAENTIIPAIPLQIAHMWHILKENGYII